MKTITTLGPFCFRGRETDLVGSEGSPWKDGEGWGGMGIRRGGKETTLG